MEGGSDGDGDGADFLHSFVIQVLRRGRKYRKGETRRKERKRRRRRKEILPVAV